MTVSAEVLAEYLDRSFAPWRRRMTQPYPWIQIDEYLNPWDRRPSTEELRDWFVADGEFQALRLGRWLGTPQGELIAAALEQVSPPFLREDEKLLADGLNLAVQMQSAGKQQEAGKVALSVVLGAGVGAVLWMLTEA
jgi:hypothetical protein